MKIDAKQMLQVVVVLCLLAPLALTGRADTITFTNGKVLKNVEANEEGDHVRVKRADGTTVVYPREMISGIEKGSTLTDEFESKRKLIAPADAPARLLLAKWCREQKLNRQADEILKEVLVIDPLSKEAHEGLRYIEYGGKWFATPADLAEAELQRSKDDLASLREIARVFNERGLAPPRKALEYILLLAPDDEEAHRALGHLKVAGNWELDAEQAKTVEIVTKVMEALKSGTKAKVPWKAEPNYMSLGDHGPESVSDYSVTKLLTGEDARMAFLATRLGWIGIDVDLIADGTRHASLEELNKIGREANDLKLAGSGDKAAIKRLAPGDYSVHLLKIKSVAFGKETDGREYQVILEKLKGGWKVVEIGASFK